MSLQTRTARTARQLPGGFTLMEMLIVIAIMLLLVIATLPRIKQTLEDSKLRESSRQLNSYIAMAKARASSTGRPCGIYLVSEKLGDPSAYPGVYQSSQLYLAEVPAPYSGDTLNARAFITNVGGGQPLNAAPPWEINPVNVASMATLQLLVDPGEPFAIQLDYKGPIFQAQRDPNPNTARYYITNSPIDSNNRYVQPLTATGIYDPNNPNLNPNAGYAYSIYRNPRRIGAPLSLPRGTVIDLGYSGFGTNGMDFGSCGMPVNTPPGFVVVMFAPSGRVTNVMYQVYDTSNANQGNAIYPFRTVNSDAQGTVHFLIGRPEKVLNNLASPFSPNTNIADNNALWVSVGRLTGSVVTTENAPNVDFVFTNPPPNPAVQFQERQAYLTIAREFAITQDVKGGQ